MYLARMTSGGQWTSVQVVPLTPLPAGYSLSGAAPAVAPDGTAYLKGAFFDRLQFGATLLNPTPGLGSGVADGYVACLSPVGQWGWVQGP